MSIWREPGDSSAPIPSVRIAGSSISCRVVFGKKPLLCVPIIVPDGVLSSPQGERRARRRSDPRAQWHGREASALGLGLDDSDGRARRRSGLGTAASARKESTARAVRSREQAGLHPIMEKRTAPGRSRTSLGGGCVSSGFRWLPCNFLSRTWFRPGSRRRTTLRRRSGSAGQEYRRESAEAGRGNR
jgi:hypothetical protein